MSELRVIEEILDRTAQRRRWDRAWRGCWRGLLFGALLWIVVLAVYKVLPIPPDSILVAGMAGGLCALAGGLIGGWRRSTPLETARWVESRQALQERLSTALEAASSPTPNEWQLLVIHDAARHAGAVDPQRLLPFHLPKVSRWALLVLVLGAGLGFAPEYRSQAHLQKQADAANIRDTGKQLANLVRQNLKDRPPVLEPTQKAMENVAELGDKLAKVSLTRSEALRDLASATERLSQQQRELGKNPSLKPLERAARETGGGTISPSDLQKQMEALQKALGQTGLDADKLNQLQKDLQKLQQAASGLKDSLGNAAAREQMLEAMSELARQARDLGASLPNLEEAMAALQANQTDLFLKELEQASHDLEKLKQMAKALQQLKQQAAKLGKDLPEQLKHGQAQAAQATLSKMIERLKAGDLTQEEMQKMIEEVTRAIEPGNQYGRVGEFLKEGAQQMGRGQKPDAAQSLAKASEELQRLLDQLADAEALAATLAALDRAQMCVGTCQGWNQYQGPPRAGKGGKPGSGVGTWADESGWTYFNEEAGWDNSNVQRPDTEPRGQTERDDKLNPALDPTRVRGQMSPGSSMPSVTLKGISIKGQSTVDYETAAVAAQAEAQSALNQDQVPRAYRNTVRDYFDDLKK
jgi:arginine repressor